MLAGLALLAAGGVAQARPPLEAQGPLVLELFTSQGCSSCPPADALASHLAETRPDLLVLDFHVDYWNKLGWHDPFSLPGATARQQAYAALLQTELYTPQLVAGGVSQAIGSEPGAVAAAITSAETRRLRLARIPLALTTEAGGLRITVGQGIGPAMLWLMGFDTAHETNIGRGENAGLVEREADIVRSITRLGAWSGAAMTRTVPRPTGEHLAIILQRADGLILASALLGGPHP